MNFKINQEVVVKGHLYGTNENRRGRVMFYGPTHFRSGAWVGVELKTKTGKNDGSIGGIRYFTCLEGHGLFVHPSRIIAQEDLDAVRIEQKIEPMGRKSKIIRSLENRILQLESRHNGMVQEMQRSLEEEETEEIGRRDRIIEELTKRVCEARLDEEESEAVKTENEILKESYSKLKEEKRKEADAVLKENADLREELRRCQEREEKITQNYEDSQAAYEQLQEKLLEEEKQRTKIEKRKEEIDLLLCKEKEKNKNSIIKIGKLESQSKDIEVQKENKKLRKELEKLRKDYNELDQAHERQGKYFKEELKKKEINPKQKKKQSLYISVKQKELVKTLLRQITRLESCLAEKQQGSNSSKEQIIAGKIGCILDSKVLDLRENVIETVQNEFKRIGEEVDLVCFVDKNTPQKK